MLWLGGQSGPLEVTTIEHLEHSADGGCFQMEELLTGEEHFPLWLPCHHHHHQQQHCRLPALSWNCYFAREGIQIVALFTLFVCLPGLTGCLLTHTSISSDS